jgi:hypothetical protein
MGIIVKQGIDTGLCRISALFDFLLWRAIVMIHQDQCEAVVPSTGISFA